MPTGKDPKSMAEYILGLSMLEGKTALLYNLLSENIENPFAKSILKSISQDSSKHANLLQAVGNSIAPAKIKEKDCAQNLGQTWQTVVDFLNEAKSMKGKQMPLETLYDRLVTLESQFGEEYYILVQMKTLQFLTKEINQLYNISLEKVKNVFEGIIRDEEHHQELIETLKELGAPKPEAQDFTPIVKFQSPDRWINYSQNNP